MSIANIKKAAPLVHCMTNYVVANFTANGLLAIGASPIMADEIEEVAEVTAISNALLLNIGTLNTRTKESMLNAGKKANELHIPVLLDPVGVGVSAFRRQAIKQLLNEVQFTCIRCNPSELAALAGVEWQARGVDAGTGDMDIASAAMAVATKYQCIVIVTGACDYITDGQKIVSIRGGHEKMQAVTGTGCLLSAICTAALAIERDTFEHLQAILAEYKEVASLHGTKDMGSFQMEILNELHRLSAGVTQ